MSERIAEESEGEPTRNTHALVCPYCGHEHTDDLSSLEEFEEPYECEGCGDRFAARQEITYEYHGSAIA